MSTEERLAKLEIQVEVELEDLKEIKGDLRAIRAELNRYKGALGLLMFGITIALAGFKLIKDWVTN